MSRGLISAFFGVFGIIAGDVVFRTSLLHQLRPVILAPTEQAVVDPPLTVEWDGPTEMRVQLRLIGGPTTDIGIRSAPMTLTRAEFPRDGGYELILEHPRFGAFISTSRQFRVLTPLQPKAAIVAGGAVAAATDVKSNPAAHTTPRAARARLYKRLRMLSDENSRLRSENERLASEMESLGTEDNETAERSVESEHQLSDLADEHQTLLRENALLQLQLSGVVPCSVWGYFSYPRAQMTSIPQRQLLVAGPGGAVFRTPVECEWTRRNDGTAATSCFCVGNSFGS